MRTDFFIAVSVLPVAVLLQNYRNSFVYTLGITLGLFDLETVDEKKKHYYLFHLSSVLNNFHILGLHRHAIRPIPIVLGNF